MPKYDPSRLVVLEQRRHDAHRHALEASPMAAEAARLYSAAVIEVRRLEDHPATSTETKAERTKELAAARAKADDLLRRRDEAKQHMEEASERFQRAARLHDKCRAFAKSVGLEIPRAPDRGEELQNQFMTGHAVRAN